MSSLLPTPIRSALAAAAVVAVVGALVACQPRHRDHDPWTADGIELNVRSSDRNVLAGQIVVLTADASNVLGRDAQIEWDAPGGEVTTEQGGRIARIKYDRPGTYVVTTRLHIDEEQYRMQTTQITVRPVN